MVDTLSVCLKSCSRLKYDRIKIDCPIFDDFRGHVFQLLRRYEGESENTFKRKLRRKLWQFVIDLSNTPLQWDCPIEQHLDLEPSSFAKTVHAQYGSEFDSVAKNIVSYWSDRMAERYSNPIYIYLMKVIGALRDRQLDFRILASNRQRKIYAPLLHELELNEAEVFSSFVALKSVPPFDCLVTCGPFRDDFDAVFTAPRFAELFNVRWLGDNDVPGFPNYMTLGSFVPDSKAEFPSDFPVKVTVSDTLKVIETICDAKKPGTTNSTAIWNYDNFEALFVRRNRTRRKITRIDDKRPVKQTNQTHEYATVQLHFIDGSYWSLEFDQSNKPPLVYSIDRDGDHTPTKRRAALDDELPTERDLQPGMLVVVEPPASSALREMALEKHVVSRSHLAEWKSMLQCAVKNLGRVSLNFIFQTLGHPIENVESKMERWISQDSGINAPQDYETFSVVIGKFAGYQEVDDAWDEVLQLRGASIQDGRVRECNIEEYLLSSVLANFEQLIDEPRTEINVEGFEEPAVVIELSHVEFFLDGQISRLGCYRRMEDRD